MSATLRLAGLGAALAALLTGCGAEPRYFPLDPGWTWLYAVDVVNYNGHHEQVLAVTNLAPVTRHGRRLVPRLAHDGTARYYAEDPRGIARVSGPAAADEAAPQYLLRRPFVPGTRWTARGRVALLRRNLPLFRLEAEASLPLTRSVAAADEVVEVPAGRYSGCLRVEGRGAVRFESEALGVVTVEVTVTDWFAPGVGLVKSVREERPDSQALGEGRAVMELEALMR